MNRKIIEKLKEYKNGTLSQNALLETLKENHLQLTSTQDIQPIEKPVAYCMTYLKAYVIPKIKGGRPRKTRKEYVHAMLKAGIKRGTLDYAWARIFDKGGKLKE